jgi:hypothetical protein
LPIGERLDASVRTIVLGRSVQVLSGIPQPLS